MIQLSAFAATQSVTLAWNRSTDPNVVGYNVYYGVASRTYTNKIDVGNVTNATISGLVEGVTYYFAATAYNVLGVESDYSDEVVYTVPITLVNQPPTLDPLSNVTILEDAGPQAVNLTGISSGATNEFQTLTVTASSSNPGLIPAPAVTYTSPNTTGTLTFTPSANSSGTASITVTVNDNGGSNNLVSRTFTVSVISVNDSPTLNAISNVTTNEDASQQTISLSGIGSGAPNENQALVVTATSDNTGLIPNPTVTYSSPAATGTLRFTPVASANGTAVITVSVNDSGTSNNLVSRTFTVTINPVNDAPTLDVIGNLAITESAGLQTVNLTGIGSGAANESQTLVVTASSSNPGLIPSPTVNYASPAATGSLTFTPVAFSNGTATITVTVNDGAPVNNLITRTFTVTVNSVNNPPTLDPIANLAINQDSGMQLVDLTGIGSGALNENQTLTVTATSGNTALIPNPTITYTSPSSTGTLRFTPASGARGSTTITVTVNDGQATSNLVTRTFSVAVNGLPSISSIPNQIISTNSSTSPLAFVIADPETPANSLTLSAASSVPALIPTSNILFGGASGNRTVTVTPAPGQSGIANITITVSDGSAATNTTFQVTVLDQPAPPTGLTILISGNGSISPILNPQTMSIGQIYSMTAIPGPGQEFAGWSGSYSWPSAKITFFAASNLLLQANFVPSPYIPTSGSYSGLVYEDDEVRLRSAGSFTMSVTTKGNYTGKLQVGPSKYSFKGKLGLSLGATNVFAVRTGGYLVLRLRVGTNSEAGQVFGQLTDLRWVASLRGDRAGYHALTNPAPYAGSYTLRVPGQSGDDTLPAGHGYGTLTVDAAGRVKLAGAMADGSKFSQSSTLSRHGLWPFYASLYSGKGFALSWLSFTDRANDDLHGELLWLKTPTTLTKYYAGGFTNQCETVGTRYVPPPLGANVMNLTSALMEFGGGNLPFDMTNSFTLGPGNKLIASDGSGFSLSFTPTKGLFKGKVNHPTTGAPLSYGGVVMPKMNAGYGFLTGTNRTSEVILQP